MWRWPCVVAVALAGCGKTLSCEVAGPHSEEGQQACKDEYDARKAAERRARERRAADERAQQRDRDTYRASIEPCKRGDPPACLRVAAWRLAEGGHPPAEIDGPLRIACGGNLAAACFLIGDRAAALPEKVAGFARACELGHAQGCYEAATLEPSRRIVLDTRGCELEDSASCERLGNAYIDGRGVAANRDEGLRFLRLACRHGRKTACGRVGALAAEAP